MRVGVRLPGATLSLGLVLLANLPAPVRAQSVLDRPPDLDVLWVAPPGVLQFDFLHRFTVSPPPAHKVSNSPTFLLAAGLPARLMIGFNYATSSTVVATEPNELELLGRWQPLSADLGAPLDVTVEGAYNAAARSPDAALGVGRALGPVRLVAESRLLGRAYAGHAPLVALAAGGILRLGRYVALAGDAGRLSAPGERLVWGAGLQLALPYTPHTFSLQATNANTGTLEGASRAARRVRYGFAFTIPFHPGRYFGSTVAAGPAPGPAALARDSGAALSGRAGAVAGPVAATVAPDTLASAGASQAPDAAPRTAAEAGPPGVPDPAASAASPRPGAVPSAPSRPLGQPRPDSAARAPAPPRAASRPRSAQPAPQRASIRNLSFLPGRLEVPAGTTVVWTNHDALAHSIRADDGSFDSGLIAPGASWRHTFDRPGTWAFHCVPHPFMHGVIVVKKSPAAGDR